MHIYILVFIYGIRTYIYIDVCTKLLRVRFQQLMFTHITCFFTALKLQTLNPKVQI